MPSLKVGHDNIIQVDPSMYLVRWKFQNIRPQIPTAGTWKWWWNSKLGISEIEIPGTEIFQVNHVEFHSYIGV